MGRGIAGPRPVGSQKGPGGGEMSESPPEKRAGGAAGTGHALCMGRD